MISSRTEFSTERTIPGAMLRTKKSAKTITDVPELTLDWTSLRSRRPIMSTHSIKLTRLCVIISFLISDMQAITSYSSNWSKFKALPEEMEGL